MDSDNLHEDADNFDRQSCPLPEDIILPGDADNDLQLSHLAPSPTGDQVRVRTFLVGASQEVSMEIVRLHHCGYDVRLWSRPQTIPGTGEVISVYTKRRRRLD